MIIETLSELVYNFISLILDGLSIPKMPEEITNIVNEADDLILSGIQIASLFFDLPYLVMLLSIVLTVEIFGFGYNLVMWVIEKIPMADVDR